MRLTCLKDSFRHRNILTLRSETVKNKKLKKEKVNQLKYVLVGLKACLRSLSDLPPLLDSDFSEIIVQEDKRIDASKIKIKIE
jgi:hypothetical protein